MRKERPIVDDSTENDINVGSTLPFRDDSHIDSFFEMNGSTKALTDYASLKCSGPKIFHAMPILFHKDFLKNHTWNAKNNVRMDSKFPQQTKQS